MFASFTEVDKLLATREALYVQNNSRHPSSGALSILVLTYPSAEGEKVFNIPRSTTPFNICDHVDPESLRGSSSFRKYLTTGSLTVVPESEAKRHMADPAIQAAFMASYNEANNTHSARVGEQRAAQRAGAELKADQQRDQSAGMKNIIAAMDPKLAQALNINGADGQRADPKLISTRSPRFTALEARVRNKTLTDSQVASDLSLMLSDLTIDDIASVAAGGIWPPISIAWAQERLNFMSNNPAA